MNIFAKLRSFMKPLEQRREAHIENKTRGTVLATNALVADSSSSRRRGLLQHNYLRAGEGMWIVPSSGVHSYGMKFDIDVVYLDRQYRVRKTKPSMKRSRISICTRAHSVLELPSGMIAATETKKGDVLVVTLSPARQH